MFVFIISCLTEEDLAAWPGSAGRLLEVSDSGPFKENKIEAGYFLQGCIRGDPDCEQDESPRHKVHLSYHIWVSQTEITQELWNNVMENPTSNEDNADSYLPLVNVTWFEMMELANSLSEQEGLEPCFDYIGQYLTPPEDCSGYRLPTEAEWEYLSRAGEYELYAGTSNSDDLWHISNSEGSIQNSCLHNKNNYQICDLSGNAYEWTISTQVAYGEDFETNPFSYDASENMIIKGGSWRSSSVNTRVSHRNTVSPTLAQDDLGGRFVRTSLY